MYPFIRAAKELIRASRMPALENVTDVHVSHHICWPHDLDFFLEMNNGRVLTLYDTGRFAGALRGGLIATIRKEGWALTMAGASVRFRARIRAFERFDMRSRAVCWDDKFMYLEQSMWKKGGVCASHVLYRAAVTDKDGLVGPERVLAAMDQPNMASPQMPEWIARWATADQARPWPPMQDAAVQAQESSSL
ncbi:MAG: acyl-CoA thioesterase [Pseudomonadota bacterium]